MPAQPPGEVRALTYQRRLPARGIVRGAQKARLPPRVRREPGLSSACCGRCQRRSFRISAGGRGRPDRPPRACR
ncbi:MAG: hypothetical protein LBE67_16680 [Kocuria palustris]|nr:hypothetical protein [Kocuria palustris]